ncbi:hypothetical protein [Phenylobacterium sp.]|jgi:hypothetical protein|uniref:hypothetical protein n=1 Tax=Phenylobacterium sp. TaxID=1871053 RepID=UPI002F95CED8
MSSRIFTALLIAGAWLAAGPALGQELKVRPGTAAVEGAPGSLQDVPAPAPILGPRLAPGFSPPRFNGKPDFTGVWNNETLTGINRPAAFGSRLVLTEAEARIIEGENATLLARANAPTEAGATIRDIEAKDTCSGGRSGAAQVCNYDAAWTAPGEKVMRVNGQPRTSLLTTPDGQYPIAKRQETAAERQRRARAAVAEGSAGESAAERNRGPQNDNPETRGLAERCIIVRSDPPMFDGLYNNNHYFQMATDHVAIVTEMIHDVRVIRLNSTHRADGVRPWFGDPIGWWEGDTLVVETTNLPESQAYRGSWEHLKVIERFTMVSPERMNYRFEIVDPTMWDKPWGGEYELVRGGPMFEYACHEGNYGLANILAGARAEDAQSAGRE